MGIKERLTHSSYLFNKSNQVVLGCSRCKNSQETISLLDTISLHAAHAWLNILPCVRRFQVWRIIRGLNFMVIILFLLTAPIKSIPCVHLWSEVMYSKTSTKNTSVIHSRNIFLFKQNLRRESSEPGYLTMLQGVEVDKLNRKASLRYKTSAWKYIGCGQRSGCEGQKDGCSSKVIKKSRDQLEDKCIWDSLMVLEMRIPYWECGGKGPVDVQWSQGSAGFHLGDLEGGPQLEVIRRKKQPEPGLMIGLMRVGRAGGCGRSVIWNWGLSG